MLRQAVTTGRLRSLAARGLVLAYLRETVPDALRAVAPTVEALALRIEASLAGGGRA